MGIRTDKRIRQDVGYGRGKRVNYESLLCCTVLCCAVLEKIR